MTIYGYCRVSSQEQKEKGLSISAQKDRLISAGVLPENIYTDAGITAGVKEDDAEFSIFQRRYFFIKIDLQARKDFLVLINKLSKDDEIKFVKWDRISRNVIFGDAFCSLADNLGVILTPLEDGKERILRRMLQVFSEEELFKTADRNRSIHDAIYARGGWPYRGVFGYTRNSKKEDKTLLFPDLPEGSLIIKEDEAAKVRAFFEGVAAGRPPDEVAASVGIPLSTGYSLFRSRVVLGETHSGKNDWKPSPLIPPIVSQALFDKARANIRGKTLRAGERKDGFTGAES